MSQLLEAAEYLTIPELLHVLGKKLGVECTKLQKYNPPAASITSLEVEIKSLETRAFDVLRFIISLRNLLQPVNKLPPEILSSVAKHLLHEGVAEDARPIIPLTHVCRYWRQSITSDPTNWAMISNFSNGLTTLSLERVGMVPLEVSLVAKEGTVPCHLPTSYIQNIVTLQVKEPTTIDFLRKALPKFPQSTPNLRSLKFASDPGFHWDRSVDPFGSLTPSINRIHLAYVPLYPSILHLRSLTELTYVNPKLDLHLDILLDFLVENPSLERVILVVTFTSLSFLRSNRQTPIENRLRYLSISHNDSRDAQALISNIALTRGAHLVINIEERDKGLNDVLSGVPTTHLSNLRSPTFMEYRCFPREIQLNGPNGKFSSRDVKTHDSSTSFQEFPLLSLTNVREFRFMHRTPELPPIANLHPPVFHPSDFPALETLTIDCETNLSAFLSSLFSNPSSPPSLKTLAFLNCDLGGEFMERLTRYASKRKETTSAWLYRVVIVNPDGVFPGIGSVRNLARHVPIVDVKVGTELPKDLT